MGLFSIFKKDKTAHRGFHVLRVKSIDRLTSNSIKIVFDVPSELEASFTFIPGQYITLLINHGGKEERRSYSLCNGPDESLAIAVKEVPNGTISVWLNRELKVGDEIQVSEPQGNFTLNATETNVVAIAAGSGITPIMSIAKQLQATGGNMQLFYGNRTEADILFKSELGGLDAVKGHYALSGETKDGFLSGRIDKTQITALIKQDLDMLKSDAFFICGPEQMIMEVKETLEFFGVNASKIRFELFTTPVLMVQESVNVQADFSGDSKVKVILDGEVANFTLNTNGKSLLEASENAGIDAPYSCKGGVCCSCKAKVVKGSVKMDLNYALTDQEVAKGYILTCQSHPTSEELTISFDE
jgi:ring-1,2-phenylacetyl-CoA epoxidase subunit PaaE